MRVKVIEGRSSNYRVDDCDCMVNCREVKCIANVSRRYTAKNATDLLQVVKFTGLLQLVNKLQQAC